MSLTVRIAAWASIIGFNTLDQSLNLRDKEWFQPPPAAATNVAEDEEALTGNGGTPMTGGLFAATASRRRILFDGVYIGATSASWHREG